MKTKFQIIIDTSGSLPPSNEQRMEMLAYVRTVLKNFTTNFPETKFTVLSEVTLDEIAEAIHGDNQSKLNCVYYDCAQGRHKCVNPVVKSSRCNGVCKDYNDKR